MRMWQHFASLLWIGEYAPVPVIITGAFFCLEKSATACNCVTFLNVYHSQPQVITFAALQCRNIHVLFKAFNTYTTLQISHVLIHYAVNYIFICS